MFRFRKSASSTRSNIELTSIQSEQSTHDLPTLTKWSTVYWVLLKIMCLYHGRRIVSTRRCQRCFLLNLEHGNECDTSVGAATAANGVVGFDVQLSNDLFPCAISSPAGWLDEEEEDDADEIPSEDERTEICEVCRSMWWNAEGKWVKYGESDIGKQVKSSSSNMASQILVSK